MLRRLELRRVPIENRSARAALHSASFGAAAWSRTKQAPFEAPGYSLAGVRPRLLLHMVPPVGFEPTYSGASNRR
jgi:hypothetical protein